MMAQFPTDLFRMCPRLGEGSTLGLTRTGSFKTARLSLKRLRFEINFGKAALLAETSFRGSKFMALPSSAYRKANFLDYPATFVLLVWKSKVVRTTCCLIRLSLINQKNT